MNHPDPIVRRMHACVLASIPSILWGPPGTGKTARVMAYGRARVLHVERWLLSRCEPIDLKPRVYDGGKIVTGQPPELERLHKAGGGLLFKDEFNRATREVEGAALDIIDNPPPGVSVLAACNPPSRGQSARNLGSAAANRFCHLDVSVDPEAWANAQVGGWPEDGGAFQPLDGAALATADARVAALVGAFIRSNGPDMLENEPEDPVAAGKPWPSARTWDYVRKLHAVAMAIDLDAADTLALVQGCVGPGPAVAYLAFCADADLPDPEALLADPDGYTFDAGRVDRCIVAMTAVVGALDRKFTEDRWKAAWTLVGRLVAPGMPDVAPGVVASDLLTAAHTRLTQRNPDAAKKLFEKGIHPGRMIPSRVANILKPPAARP